MTNNGPPSDVSTAATAKTATETATCPYCALLCDDLALTANADLSLTIRRNGCARATVDYARPPLAATALVAGRSASIDDAVAAAKRLLKSTRHPLFAGLATDIDGIRALVDLAEQRGAILDHVHGDALATMSRLLQTRGWYATTLSEVRNRADFVLVIDADLTNRYENFARRCLQPVQRPHTNKRQARQVAWLGQRKRLAGDTATADTLFCSGAQLPEALGGLLAALRGQPLRATSAGGVRCSALATLAAAMRAAQYCAVVFAPGSLGAGATRIIAGICDIVDELNNDGRAGILALGGDDGGQSAIAACSWVTGYPLRVGFGKTLDYAPGRHRTERLVAEQRCDAVLWVDAFGRHPLPPAAALEHSIVLGAVKPRQARSAAVFIPVGTPGVDHFARLARADSVVTLGLPAQRDAGLPGVAEIVARLGQR